MIIWYLVMVVIAYMVVLVLFPICLRLFCGWVLGLHEWRVKLKNAWTMEGMVVEGRNLLWGYDRIILYCGKAQVWFSWTHLRIIVQIDQPKVYLLKSIHELKPVRMIDGQQEPNLIYNLLTILQQQPKQPTSPHAQSHTTMNITANAVTNFISMILLQFVTMQINQAEFISLDHIPPSQLHFHTLSATRQALLLMQCCCDSIVSINKLRIKSSIQTQHEWQINLHCMEVKVENIDDVGNVLMKASHLMVKLDLPLTFSLSESLKRRKVTYELEQVELNTQPQDFEDFCLTLNNLLFNPSTESLPNQNRTSTTKLIISHITLQLFNLYQPPHDQPPTKQTLSHIQCACLHLDQVKCNQTAFTIDRTTLSVEKVSNKVDLFSLEQLCIGLDGRNMEISHDDVRVYCEKEEIALLAKLFRLVNDRMRKEQFQYALYKPFFHIGQQYLTGHINIYELIIKYCTGVSSPPQPLHSLPAHNLTLQYNPKQIQIQLYITSLTHRIYLSETSYTQQMSPTHELQHKLVCKRLSLQHKNLKQFHVHEFQLFYGQKMSENELSVFIDEIKMNQTVETLKDYLEGYTLWKELLQVSGGEVEGPVQGYKGKVKYMEVKKIYFHLMNQKVKCSKLLIKKYTQPNGSLAQLTFSLGKCDFIVEQLPPPPLHKYSSKQHCLASIACITMNTNPHYHTHKSQIHIKSPTIILPSTDISTRVMQYVQSYAQLSPYLDAFMQNVTNEQLKAHYRKSKKFLHMPTHYDLVVSELCIGMADSPFDHTLLKLNRLYYERVRYGSADFKDNQVYLLLKTYTEKHHLCEFTIKRVDVHLQPISELTNSAHVQEWLADLVRGKEARLIEVRGYKVGLLLTKLGIRIRDYPLDILSLSQFDAQAEYLQSKNIYEETKHNLKAKASVGEVDINVGLSLLSGWQEVQNKLYAYMRAMDNYQNTKQYLETMLENNRQSHKYKPYWHVLHKHCRWRVEVNKSTPSNMKILTLLTPYEHDNSLMIKIGGFCLYSEPEQTTFHIKPISVFLKDEEIKEKSSKKSCKSSDKSLKQLPQQQILQISSHKLSIKTLFIEPHLQVQFRLSIAEAEIPNKLIITDRIIRYFSSLQQLRVDWLLLYGLIDSPLMRQSEGKKDRMNYLELMKVAVNKKLKNKDKQLSFWSVLKTVLITVKFSTLEVQFLAKNSHLSLLFDDMFVSFFANEKNESWNIEGFRLKLATILCRINAISGKKYSQMTNRQVLDLYKSTTEKKQIKQNAAPKIFMACQKIKLKFNQYQKVEGQLHFLEKKLEFKKIRLEISQELKKVLQKIKHSFEDAAREFSGKGLLKKMKHEKSPIEKLRQAVFMVMRMNKQKKRNLKWVKMLSVVKQMEIALCTNNTLAILSSPSPVSIMLHQNYSPYDRYHIDPIKTVIASFTNLQLWIKQHHIPLQSNLLHNKRILKAQTVNLEYIFYQNQQLPEEYTNLLSQKNIPRPLNVQCAFEDGVMEVDGECLEVLRELTQFIGMLLYSREKRKKQQDNYEEKYADLMMTGKETIKNKLMWSFSDSRKMVPPELLVHLQFCLSRITILLQTKTLQQTKLFYDPFVRIKSSTLSFITKIFTNGNINKQFHMHDFQAVNLREEEGSTHRMLLDMNHEDNVAFFLVMENCDLASHWNFIRLIHVHMNPITLKLTESLYNQIYDFMFGRQSTTIESNVKLEELPDYYLQIVIDEIKVKIWFKTDSIIKRLQGVNTKLSRYEVSQQFITTKGLYDQWVRFIVKQMASQFFNVLSQKLFG